MPGHDGPLVSPTDTPSLWQPACTCSLILVLVLSARETATGCIIACIVDLHAKTQVSYYA